MRCHVALTALLAGAILLTAALGPAAQAAEPYVNKILISATLPADVKTVPLEGKAAELGAVVAEAFKGQKPELRMALDKDGVRTGTILVRIQGLKPQAAVNMKWNTNCAVNSTYGVNRPLILASKDDEKQYDEPSGEHLGPKNYNPKWMEGVLVAWTRHRHQWPKATLTKYTYSPSRYDVTFERTQVKAHEAQQAALARRNKAIAQIFRK